MFSLFVLSHRKLDEKWKTLNSRRILAYDVYLHRSFHWLNCKHHWYSYCTPETQSHSTRLCAIWIVSGHMYDSGRTTVSRYVRMDRIRRYEGKKTHCNGIDREYLPWFVPFRNIRATKQASMHTKQSDLTLSWRNAVSRISLSYRNRQWPYSCLWYVH